MVSERQVAHAVVAERGDPALPHEGDRERRRGGEGEEEAEVPSQNEGKPTRGLALPWRFNAAGFRRPSVPCLRPLPGARDGPPARPAPWARCRPGGSATWGCAG